MDALRIGQGLGDVAAIGGDDAPLADRDPVRPWRTGRPPRTSDAASRASRPRPDRRGRAATGSGARLRAWARASAATAPAIEGGRRLGEDAANPPRCAPAAGCSRSGCARRARPVPSSGRGGERVEGVAQGQIEEHLLAVVGIGEHEFRRRLADGRDGAFALAHGDGALGVAEFDDAFEHDERCRPPSTESDQSVPRMAATAAGVLTSTPEPPRAARAQILPRLQAELGRAGLPLATSLTVRVELRPTRIWVWSANRIARLPMALVRSTSPPSTFCRIWAARHRFLAHEAHFLAALGGHDRRRRRASGAARGLAPAHRQGKARGRWSRPEA